MHERYWRGPKERQGAEAPREAEFPPGAEAPPEISRRGVMQLLGASAALAGAAGCSRGPQEYIVPYVDQPPEVTPSVPAYYATTMPVDGYGVGMIVTSREGRPIKAEGNPHHPASGGGLGTFGQASILSLYDPSRGRMVTREGAPSTWEAFVAEVTRAAPAGKKIHLLLEPTTSPHLADLVQRVRRRGDVVVHFDAAVGRSNVWAGTRLAFGSALEPVWDFARADVVLSLDADFLASAVVPASWARAWADRRRVSQASRSMSRLYVVEARATITGMSADERLRVKAGNILDVAADLLAALASVQGASVPADVRGAASSRPARAHRDWILAVARDLKAHAPASLVVAGESQPPVVHALAHAINELLGARGHAVAYVPSPVFEAGGDSHGLDGLVRAIDAGEVSTIVVVGGNPTYSAPANLEFGRRFAAVPVRAYVGASENETSRACQWYVPEAHFLESWGDARALDGTASIVQPLIEPLFDGKTAAQVMAAFVGQPASAARELVRTYWAARSPASFESFWQTSLVRGTIEGTAASPQPQALDWAVAVTALAAPPTPPAPLEIIYFADAKVHDGRFAENAWLQELGDPVTKLTWDNAALVSPATAARRSLDDEDVVELTVRGRTVSAPVLVVPGMADDVVALALGYGHTVEDRISYRVGANAYTLRDSRALHFDAAEMRKVPAHWPLARTQEHWTMEGRPIVLRKTLDEYRQQPDFAKPMNAHPTLLYEVRPSGAHQWGMTIDLNACTGCSACVVACYAENNLPVVGKDGVRLRREMDWLRIDRYYVGDLHDPAVVTQPMLCQHCEMAPCEYVCPVNATVHSSDGLNEMIYNRCVGTRFCSNNCPYKVRRFNFFNYNRDKDALLQLAMNPDVTVRARGVMEKCTYCVQRIREAEIRARREERPLRDGEIQTACQQTCPTGAIVFGDIADPSTRVSDTRKNERLYSVLHSLGTVPRTRYLARVVNPNPEIRS